jgi:hypothetical protein
MYCNSSPLTFRNNERTALEFYKIPQPPTETAYKKPLDGRLFYSRAPNENEHQTAVLKQRISRPPPCPLPLHILRLAGPLFLPMFLVYYTQKIQYAENNLLITTICCGIVSL